MNRLSVLATITITLLTASTAIGVTPLQSEFDSISRRFAEWISGKPEMSKPDDSPGLELLHQDYVVLQINRSALKTPLRIGKIDFDHGLGSHATSHILLRLPEGAQRFVARVGVDNNYDTKGERGSVVFAVRGGDKELYRSDVLRGGDEPADIDIPVGGLDEIHLHITNGGDGDGWDQADWADAAIILKGDKKMWVDEMKMEATEWLGSGAPFSFKYDGKDSREFLTTWKTQSATSRSDKARTVRTTTYLDEKTGLEVVFETTIYADLPAIEWVLYFRNTGRSDTPIIEDIHPLDMTISSDGGNTGYLLHAARGGLCTPQDYEPLMFPLGRGRTERLSSAGGRSSNRHLPFFNIEGQDKGLLVGVGWSGEWQADCAMDQTGTLRLVAGMPRTHLLLHPDETIRTPGILLISWNRDRLRGHNMLRQLIYRYKTPLLSGKKPLPPTQCNTWFPVGDDGGRANEKNQIELLRSYKPIGIEYLVMDAGWYGSTPEWSENVGTWTPRKDTFPNGLSPVGEVAKETGIAFGMWFEPERVRPGTWLDIEHPDWLLKTGSDDNRLLDLGIPEARDWFIEMVSEYVREVPLGYFRHDFNMEPIAYWQSADKPDRVGMTEIRYIENLYAIWDEIHRRFPDLMIEGCASGGRRIDLESLSRCHTYWKSDLYGNIEANQGHTYGANLYIPGSYLNTPLFDLSENKYAYRSQLGCAMCLGIDPRPADFNASLVRERVAEFKRLRHLAVGDFYPLLPYHTESTHWMGYQFHRADLDEGMALLFRRGRSPYTAVSIRLQGLSPDVTYELKLADSGETRRGTGKELSDPITVSILEPGASVMLNYKKVSGRTE